MRQNPQSATKIQSFFRMHLAYKEKEKNLEAQNIEWQDFVDALIPHPGRIKSLFLSLSADERLDIDPWVSYLKNKQEQIDTGTIMFRG